MVSTVFLASRALTLVVQDGKYDKLLRLLYDDIQKYETEVTIFCSRVQPRNSFASACRFMQIITKI